MYANTQLLLLLLIAALGFGCEQDRSNLDASADLEGTGQAERTETVVSALTVSAADSGTGDKDASESPPVIDFPMLDEVRSLDLIDMELSFPESLKKLDGRRVSLIGFMAPFDNLRDMRRCMIVPSYVGCTFCSPPKLTQVVYITQGSDDASQRSYPFIESASHVSGIFRLSLPESDHEGKKMGFAYSLENAVVTAHTGDVPTRAPGHGNARHQQRATRLAPVAMADLVRHVADLIGRELLHPIEIETVSDETFGDLVRASLETTFPEATRTARSQAFSLFGLLPEDADWIDTLTEFQLAWRVAATDETGKRIYLLDSVPGDHPYVRLELVGEIADALTRQHFPGDRTGPGAENTNGGLKKCDDARRAHEALWHGIRIVTINRYAMSHGISRAAQPPVGFVKRALARQRKKKGIEQTFASNESRMWLYMPVSIGPFFVESLVGTAGPITGVDTAFTRPPSTTMEFFRPRWYQDATLWRQDPVPSDFADNLMDARPIHTDVLGIGGLVPLLTKWYSLDVAKSLAGGWAGDRWAVWQFPDGAWALMFETRWQDEESAIQFREAIPDHPFCHLPEHRPGSTRVQLLRADSADAFDRLTSAMQAAP